MNLAWTAHATSLPHVHGEHLGMALLLGLFSLLAWRAWKAR
jgi:hypothetical protein